MYHFNGHNHDDSLIKAARESHALCTILMKVNHQENIECIIDCGSEVIAMSDEVCNCVGLAYGAVHLDTT
jgi:hypothetical protein